MHARTSRNTHTHTHTHNTREQNTMRNLIDNVSSSRGAPMGRPSYTMAADGGYIPTDAHGCSILPECLEELKRIRAAQHHVFNMQRITLDGGGYDAGGAYWGARSNGERIYIARNTADTVQRVYGVKTRAEAIDELRAEFDGAHVVGTRRRWAHITMQRLRESTMTEAQLRFARKVLAAAINGRTQQVDITSAEAWDIVELVETLQGLDASPRITGKWSERGAEYLRALAFKADGSLRDNAFTRQFHKCDADVLRAVSHFTLHALDVIDDDTRNGWVYVAPVYHLIGCNGDGIIYTSIPWQSGGDGPRIVGRSFAIDNKGA